QGHPFNDANKRTGFLTAAYYLEQVGLPLPAETSADEVVALCLQISKGDLREIAAIQQELQGIWLTSGRNSGEV
ncbi:MAG: hypothetical protein ACYDAR_12475, partial [Thermomicrobiales bacterium]